MILEVRKYGDPVLRKKGAPVEKITAEIRQFIADLIETMHANHGVGLAAQQVGRALQVTVLDVREVKDRPSTLERDGQPADVDQFMPLVLINPQIQPHGQTVAAAEGCLSFPEIYGEIPRPEFVEVTALNETGRTIEFRAGGLLARAIQHEVDHLNGILFIDRMSAERKRELQSELDTLQAQTKAALRKK
ncbi:MAG TPA: peptide deformylase [Verrucomicrobiae bacterium]|jgi:peptide deformylase|nr:peptide deformylase [Verrucomicrobiae bacterium]